MVAKDDRCPALDTLLRRHVCNKPSVKQYMLAADDASAGSDEWKKLLHDKLQSHAKVCTPTQIIEDMFAVQKGYKVLKTSNKLRRPEKSMSLVLSQKVITQKHKFKTPSTDQPIGGKTVRLQDEVWKMPRSLESMPWGEVVSTNAVSPYYSCKAENFTQNCSDLPLLRQAEKQGDLNAVRGAWIWQLAVFEHKLLLKVKMNGKEQWHHCLFHQPTSAIALWLGQLQVAKSRFGAVTYFVHDSSMQDLFLFW